MAASVMSIFTFSMLIAPVVGPIAGGFLAEGAGWRWIFWLLTIVVSLEIILYYEI
jgi:MFS family permease